MFGNSHVMFLVLALFVAILSTNNVTAVELAMDSKLKTTIQHPFGKFAEVSQGFAEQYQLCIGNLLEHVPAARSAVAAALREGKEKLTTVINSVSAEITTVKTMADQASQHISAYFNSNNISDWQKTLLTAAGSSIVAYLTVPLVFGAVGFTSAGVAAGSMAAAWQASLGNVAAGSTFASLTSCAMTPSSVAALAGSVSTVSGTVAGLVTYMSSWGTHTAESE